MTNQINERIFEHIICNGLHDEADVIDKGNCYYCERCKEVILDYD